VIRRARHNDLSLHAGGPEPAARAEGGSHRDRGVARFLRGEPLEHCAKPEAVAH
jgi:hypothetical protein